MNSTSNEDDETRKTLRLRANKMVQSNYTSMVKMSFGNLFGEASKTLFKNEIKLALEEALQTPIQGYIAAQEGMRIRTNKNHVLTENDFKKLIIIGEKDPVLEAQTSLKEAETTRSEGVVFPNGHMSHIENKSLLIATLKEFVKNC
jgi:pimeloyl-ACP methyl ester carboxylesterase